METSKHRRLITSMNLSNNIFLFCNTDQWHLLMNQAWRAEKVFGKNVKPLLTMVLKENRKPFKLKSSHYSNFENI